MISNLIASFNYSDEAYKIAKENDILIVEEDLGTKVCGYYHNVDGVKMIHINSRIWSNKFRANIIKYFLRHSSTDIEFLVKTPSIEKMLAQHAQSCTLETQ